MFSLAIDILCHTRLVHFEKAKTWLIPAAELKCVNVAANHKVSELPYFQHQMRQFRQTSQRLSLTNYNHTDVTWEATRLGGTLPEWETLKFMPRQLSTVIEFKAPTEYSGGHYFDDLYRFKAQGEDELRQVGKCQIAQRMKKWEMTLEKIGIGECRLQMGRAEGGGERWDEGIPEDYTFTAARPVAGCPRAPEGHYVEEVVMREKTPGLKNTHHEEVERPQSPSDGLVSRWGRCGFSAWGTAYKRSNASPGASAKQPSSRDEIGDGTTGWERQQPHLLPFAPRSVHACRCEKETQDHRHSHLIIRQVAGRKKEAARDFWKRQQTKGGVGDPHHNAGTSRMFTVRRESGRRDGALDVILAKPSPRSQSKARLLD